MATKESTITICFEDTTITVSVPNKFIASMRTKYVCTERDKDSFVFSYAKDFYDCVNAVKAY